MENAAARPGVTPVVKWLLIANIVIFIADIFSHFAISAIGAFSIESAIRHFHLWQVVTFQFLHASLGHVLFNSIALYFFGPWMERWWGSRKFLGFYLLCGIAGAAFYTLLVLLGFFHDDPRTPLVGASAGIYGILMGVAIIAPNLRVMLLIPPVEMSMKQLAMLILAIAVVFILFNLPNAGGEAGHLGGAILGYFLTRHPHLLGNRPRVEAFRPPAFRRKSEAKLRPRSKFETDEDDEVDRLLDKISRDGFQSLTAEERETLNKASNRRRDR